MKGRLLITFVLLAMAAAACTEPGVVGGDDASQETESVTNDALSNDSAAGDEATDEGSATDPGALSDRVLTSEEASTEEPSPDQEEQTIPPTGDSSPLVTNPPKETPTTATTSATATGSGTVDPGLLPFVDQAKADLAVRLGVDARAIALISAELVEWSDASLGCPQPGMVYAQVPTDGSLILLSHGGTEYRYHTGGSVYVPFLCE